MSQPPPHPVCFFGECHGMLFDNVLFADAAGGQVVAFGKVPLEFALDTIWNGAGKLNPNIARTLESEFIGESGVRAPIVIMCGETDSRAIAEGLGPTTLVPPFDLPPLAEAGLAEGPLVPYSLVAEIIERKVKSLPRFVDHLRANGFERVALHSIVPQSPPSRGSSAHWRPSRLRHQIVSLMNRRLAEIARACDCTFIDVWDELAVAGVLRDEYVLDGLHVNRRAALATMRRVMKMWFDAHGEVTLRERLRPACVLGDAGVEVFRNRLFVWGERQTVARVNRIEGYSFANALVDNRINAGVMYALQQSGLLRMNPDDPTTYMPAHLPSSPSGRPIPATGVSEPPLIIAACGMNELAIVSARPEGALLAVPDVAPFATSLAALKRMGFEDIAIAPLPMQSDRPDILAWVNQVNASLGLHAERNGIVLWRS